MNLQEDKFWRPPCNGCRNILATTPGPNAVRTPSCM
ncbi:hypothetical protein [Rhodovulum sp. MB263]